MEFFQLEAFLAVARLKSFAQAAEELAHTQPAISISIKKLEQEIGSPLFDRYRRQVKLTDAGSALIEYAAQILNLRQEAFTAIEELQHLHEGKVRIGANESTNLYLLPKMILTYREHFPRIKVEVFRSSSIQLPREIKERNLDFGIIAFDPADRELESFPILEDELVLIVPPDHILAKKRKATIETLGTETFVAHNVKSPSRDHVIAAFRDAGVPLNIGIELSSIETIKQFVEMNLGIAFVPRLAITNELREKKFVIIPLRDFKHKRILRVIFLRDKVHSHAAGKFLDVLRKPPGSRESGTIRRVLH